MSDDPEGLLREVWRVLAPSGRLIAVIPNRRGVWTRTDNTPFGHGRPYSRAQINELLRQTWFTPPAWGGGGRAVAAVRGRAYRGGDQAGLSGDPRAPRAHAAHSIAAAGAGAVVNGDAGMKGKPLRSSSPRRRGPITTAASWFGELSTRVSSTKGRGVAVSAIALTPGSRRSPGRRHS